MSSAEVRPNRDVQRTRQRASLRKGSRSSTVRDDLPRAGVNLLRKWQGRWDWCRKRHRWRSSFQLRSSSYGGQVGCPFSGRCAPCVEPFLRVLHPNSAKAVVRRLRHGTGAGIRTQDRRFRKPMLYPTELRPHVSLVFNDCDVEGMTRSLG